MSTVRNPSALVSPSPPFLALPPASLSSGTPASAPASPGDLFRQAMVQAPRYTNTIGETRCACLEGTLRQHEIALTQAERRLLTEVFSEFRNQTLDHPIQILMLSLNRDFQLALQHPGLTPAKAQKLVKSQAFFAERCLDFTNECRTQALLSIFSASSPTPITVFNQTLGIIAQIAEQNFVSGADRVKEKIALWKILLSHRDYFLIATTAFQQVSSPREDGKTDAAESPISLPSVERIDVQTADFLSEGEMTDFLIEYTDWLKSYYTGATDEGSLLNMIRPKLESMRGLLSADALDEVKAARQEILGVLMQKRHEVADELARSHKGLRRLARMGVERLPVAVKPITRLTEFEGILDRFIVSLDTLIEKQRLLLMTKRLYSNLESAMTIPEAIDASSCNKDLQQDFLKIYGYMMEMIDPRFSTKAQAILKTPFDPVRTPDMVQDFCQKKFPHCHLPGKALAHFERVHAKYLHISAELSGEGKDDELDALEKSYTSLCFSLIPLFFCIQDIQSLRKNCLRDESEIIPDDILDCFDLNELAPNQVNSSTTPEEDFVSVTPSPEPHALTPSPVVFRPLTVPTQPKIAPRPLSVTASPASSTFRFRSGMKPRHIKQEIQRMFKASVEQGKKHTTFYSEEGKLMTVMSRSNKREIPRKTLSAMGKQLRSASADDV